MESSGTLPEAHASDPDFRVEGRLTLRVFVAPDGAVEVNGVPVTVYAEWMGEGEGFELNRDDQRWMGIPDRDTLLTASALAGLDSNLVLALYESRLFEPREIPVIIADTATTMEDILPVMEAARAVGHQQIRFMTARRPDARL